MTNRKQQLLEFRGIPLQQLVTYLLEYGGIQTSSTFPISFDGKGWQADILEEKEVQITSRFRVNSVLIQFSTETEEQLSQLIAGFRKKTMRVGG